MSFNDRKFSNTTLSSFNSAASFFHPEPLHWRISDTGLMDPGLLGNDCGHPQDLRFQSPSSGGFRMPCVQPYCHNLRELATTSILLAFGIVIALISWMLVAYRDKRITSSAHISMDNHMKCSGRPKCLIVYNLQQSLYLLHQQGAQKGKEK